MIDEKGYRERGYKRNRSEEFCHSMHACSSSPPFLVLSGWNLSLDHVFLSSFIVFLPLSPNYGFVPSCCAMGRHTVHSWLRYGGAFSCSCQLMWSICWEVRKEVKKTDIDSSHRFRCLLKGGCQKRCSRSTLLNIYGNCFLNLKLERLLICCFFLLVFLFQEMPIHWEFTHNPLGAVSEFDWQQKGSAHNIWKGKRASYFSSQTWTKCGSWMFSCCPFIWWSHIETLFI